MQPYHEYVTLLDMDAYFASLMLLAHPEYKNRAIGVTRKGVIIATNYLAKLLGVDSGAIASKAKREHPEIKLLPENLELFRLYSRMIFRFIQPRVPYVEPYPQDGKEYLQDEWYINWTDVVNSYEEQREKSEELRQYIKRKINLTATVGNSKNRTLAKLSADLGKPNGNFTITDEDLERVVYLLPVRKLNGIGEQYEERLKRILGLERITAGDLARANYEQIIQFDGILRRVFSDILPGYVDDLGYRFR